MVHPAAVLPARATLSPISEKTPKGKIDYEYLFLHSHLAKYIAKTAICASIAAVPIIAGTLGAALPALIGTACIVAAVALPIILAVVNFKDVFYEISLIFTVSTKKVWWKEIDDNVILGGIPQQQHLEDLKALGITHVLTMVRGHELEPGIVHPITKEQWKESGIEQLHLPTPDFKGVAPTLIDQGVEFLEEARKAGGKVYIHCKAGRGRSATIVVADKLKQYINTPTRNEERAQLKQWYKNSRAYIYNAAGRLEVAAKSPLDEKKLQDKLTDLLYHFIEEVKDTCPDISLRDHQQSPIIEYIRKYVLLERESIHILRLPHWIDPHHSSRVLFDKIPETVLF